MKKREYSIVYIVGWCRSGSTILGNILNEIDGFFHTGELHYLWRNTRALGSNTRCGCGDEITECEVWSEVIARLSAAADWDETVRDVIADQAGCRTRHTWHILHSGTKRQSLERYFNTYQQTCDTIADVTGARVIVDGGKFASEAALLRAYADVPVKILHLVRDPRSVAASWAKPKAYVEQMSALRSTCNWLGFNAAAHALARAYPSDVLSMRYEDFAATPAPAIDDVLRFLGEDAARNPVVGNQAVLSGNHTVTGNPDRMQSGPVTIRNVIKGTPKGLRARRLISTLISTPQRLRYGYPW